MLTELQYQKQKDFERLFASSAFVDPEYVLDTCGWLKPEQLVDERIRKFWELLLDGRSNIEASFDADLQPDMLKWVNQNPTSQAAPDYANKIIEHSYLAGISIQLSKIAEAAGNNDLVNVQQLISDMAAHRPKSREVLPDAEQIGLEFIEAVTKKNRDIATGIPKLDNNIGGLERQTVSVIAGRTSMGKTALALQIARNVAGPEKSKVLFFSLEMSRVSLWARMACGNADVSWLDKRASKITQDQESRLLRESDKLMQQLEKKLFVIHDPSDTDRIWRLTANEKPDLVIVDHLRLVKDKGDSEVKRQGLITERLHDMAKAQDCHVMILAQLNRGVENREKKRPLLSDLRDSGEIEENADLVLMLYRDDVYNPPDKVSPFSDTELLIRKFRDGIKDGRLWLRFNKAKQWFDPLPGGGND